MPTTLQVAEEKDKDFIGSNRQVILPKVAANSSINIF